MNNESYMYILDSVEVYSIDKDGKIKFKHCADDLLTNAGLAAMAGLIIGTGASFNVIGIGTGTIAASTTDTTLGTQLLRKVATCSRVTISTTNDTAQWVASFSNALDGLTGTASVSEVGIFNSTVVGTSTMVICCNSICCWN
jgi:hypothetical protein